MTTHRLSQGRCIGLSVACALLSLPVAGVLWLPLVMAESGNRMWIGLEAGSFVAGAFIGLCAGAPWAYSRRSLVPLIGTTLVGGVAVMVLMMLTQ